MACHLPTMWAVSFTASKGEAGTRLRSGWLEKAQGRWRTCTGDNCGTRPASREDAKNARQAAVGSNSGGGGRWRRGVVGAPRSRRGMGGCAAGWLARYSIPVPRLVDLLCDVVHSYGISSHPAGRRCRQRAGEVGRTIENHVVRRTRDRRPVYHVREVRKELGRRICSRCRRADTSPDGVASGPTNL